jgi:hypothetical protein
MGWAEDLTNWASDKLKGKDNKFGGDDALKIAGGLAGLYGLSRIDNSETLSNFFGTSSPPALGYQGKIPELSAVRSRVPLTYDPSRRPGSGGQRYFSDTRYVGKDDAAAAQATADEEAIELAAENILNPARQNRAAARKLPAGGEEGLLELFQNIRNSPYTSEAQKIAQTSGLMDLYNISPMGYSQLTGAPLYNVQAGMHPHYQAQTTPTVIPPLAGEVAPTLSDTTETVVDDTVVDDTVVDDTVVDDTVVDDTVVEDTIETATSTAASPASTWAYTPDADEAVYTTPYETNINSPYFGAAQGGLMGMYLGGSTDGMADRIPATIEDKQEARLSDGEFVIPADVVSHLGNGNSQAGASHLYEMMGKVRQARTGNSQQGKEINPNKYMPV